MVQGSTLGPSMYNFYTSDLKHVVKSYVIMFADEKNVVISDIDPNNLIQIGNEELNEIDQYVAAKQTHSK